MIIRKSEIRMSLELKAIRKAYGAEQAKVVALDGIDLVVQQGEFLCVWGASGSGKSTLLNIMGLLDTPDSGEYRFSGTDVSRLNDRQRTRLRGEKLGFIFQGFNLIPVLSAVENVMFPLQVLGRSDREARTKALELLEMVGLSAERDRRPDKMSGGQRQRVAIARALVGDPELVLADEPTASLDSATSVAILDLLRRLNRERGTTFVFSTHDSDLLPYASRNLSIRDGRIAEWQGRAPAPTPHHEASRHAPAEDKVVC
jgi:putative ABC transport system ATP-binding protein